VTISVKERKEIMKPVYFKLAAATLTVFFSDVTIIIIKVFKIKMDEISFILLSIFLFLPLGVTVSHFLGKNYEDAEENNDALFVGILIFLVITYFLIITKL
jgi:uncharacterized membrane-anchored protein